MNNYNENKSLLEVREWKELCRQEDEGLSAKEYIEKIEKIAKSVKLRYNVVLRKVKLSP